MRWMMLVQGSSGLPCRLNSNLLRQLAGLMILGLPFSCKADVQPFRFIDTGCMNARRYASLGDSLGYQHPLGL